jgi:hypothetical protein
MAPSIPIELGPSNFFRGRMLCGSESFSTLKMPDPLTGILCGSLSGKFQHNGPGNRDHR